MVTTDAVSSMQASSVSLNKQGNESGNFPQGYVLVPKGKRGMDEEYFTPINSRKGSGIVNIKLPYYGSASGVNYGVLGIEAKDFLSICNCKIKIDQVRLLEDPSDVAYSKTVQQLLEQKAAGSKFPPVLDAVKGMIRIISLIVHEISEQHLHHSAHFLTFKFRSQAQRGCSCGEVP